MYQKVDTNLNFVDREKKVEEFWKENHIFEKSMENRKEGETYTFYDGPPTANGKPHIGHVLTRVIKDMIPRYRTMKGYMVPRKAGWDTHGLPVELEVEKKLGLANGNYVYNGSFQEGDKHLGYWNISNAENADVTVTPFSDGRRLKVTMSGNEKSAVVISQEELAFATGTPYKFSFTASSDADNTLTANIGGHVYTFDIKAGETKDFAVELPSDAQYVNHDISITLGMQGTTWLDKVSLVENALVKNGSFNDGTTGYTVYVDSSAKASYVVDSLKDDNALAVTINDTGDADWKVQIKQENIKLEKGKTYKLKFKAKSSLNRQIRVVMQGQENREWSVYSSDNIVDLTNEYQTFEDTFTMNEDTDTAAFFSVCLGKIGDNQITTQQLLIS